MSSRIPASNGTPVHRCDLSEHVLYDLDAHADEVLAQDPPFCGIEGCTVEGCDGECWLDDLEPAPEPEIEDMWPAPAPAPEPDLDEDGYPRTPAPWELEVPEDTPDLMDSAPIEYRTER